MININEENDETQLKHWSPSNIFPFQNVTDKEKYRLRLSINFAFTFPNRLYPLLRLSLLMRPRLSLSREQNLDKQTQCRNPFN